MCNEGCSPHMSSSQWAEQVLFSICACVSVCKWMRVAGPDDRDWVIQGRVCALSVCLLFHSHMDLGLRWSQPDYLIQRRAATALIPHNSNAVDHCAHKPLNELTYGFRRMQMRSGSHFPSPTSTLAVQTHKFGAKCVPPGREPCVGGKCSPVLKSVVRVQGL